MGQGLAPKVSMVRRFPEAAGGAGDEDGLGHGAKERRERCVLANATWRASVVRGLRARQKGSHKLT